ncbi:MAG: hypothetical protein IT453_07385 [Planctomycetes bacterium]|nr:hypothetical protein [Planctomycetota bacterium]
MTRSHSKLLGAALVIAVGWLLFVWLGSRTQSDDATATNAATHANEAELASPVGVEPERVRDAVVPPEAPRERPIARLEVRPLPLHASGQTS